MTKKPYYVYRNNDNRIVMQRAAYIEDGCYLEVLDNLFVVYEIPIGGGQEQEIGQYYSLEDAEEKIDSLT